MDSLDSWKSDRIGACVRGENPTLLARMKSGFAVIGDTQFLPGYCVLLRYPKADSLNALSLPERSQYLLDMTLIGDAILKACRPARINYSTLMNLDRYLHTHIEARYDWEPEPYRQRPSFFYPAEQRNDPRFAYCEERYGELKREIAQSLLTLMETMGY